MKPLHHFTAKLLTLLILVITCLTTKAVYTLTDADVVVSSGEITSCSYDFSDTDIIIPGTLDGETITAIGDNVFYAKGITSVNLSGCTSLEGIGTYAFRENAIDSIDLSICTSLHTIGYYSFADNSIDSIDLSSCAALVEIKGGAFDRNDIIDVNLNGCSALLRIGRQAFSYNEITSINLSGCSSLNTIDNNAFAMNSYSSIDLSSCTALSYIGAYAFDTWEMSSYSLPVNAKFNPSGWVSGTGIAYSGGASVTDLVTNYYIPQSYTLTNDDVEVVGGDIQSCSYNFELKHIIIPNELDGQIIDRIDSKPDQQGIFQSKGIVKLTLPAGLEYIGNNAFSRNSIDTLDLERCTDLYYIGEYSFELNELDTLHIANCSALQIIGGRAFNNNNLTNLSLANCTSLEYIYIYGFLNNDIENVDFTNCSQLASISYGAFRGNKLDTVDLSPCTSLTYIGSSAFTNNNFSEFVLPTPMVPGLELRYWEDGSENTYPGGTATSVFNTEYTAILSNAYEVEFTVTDGTDPIEGAIVSLYGYEDDITDASGVAVFEKVFVEASIHYTVTKPGYTDVSEFVTVIDDNVSEAVEMDLDSYEVVFVVSYGPDPVEGVTIDLTGYGVQTTDASGLATFASVALAESVPYTINQTGFDEESGTVGVDDLIGGSASVDVRLNLTTYNVVFTVTDGVNPVAGATVAFTGYSSQTTDASGMATFTNVEPADDIAFAVNNAGYNEASGTVDVTDDDVAEPVTLTLITYTVTFNVTDGTNPVSGATVSLEGYSTVTTNALGAAEIAGVVPASNIAYTVSASTFNDNTGTVTISNDHVSKPIALTPATNALSNYANIVFSIYPNPASEVVDVELGQEAVLQLVDATGRIMLNQKLNTGTNRIDLNGFVPGYYLIHVLVNNTALVKSLIIK